MNEIVNHFHVAQSHAAFWSLRYVEENSEFLAVRDDVAEPPRLASDRGAMLTAMAMAAAAMRRPAIYRRQDCKRRLIARLQWAMTSSKISAVAYNPATMPAPQRKLELPALLRHVGSGRERFELLAQECQAAKIDSRIVDRYASLDVIHGEQLYLSNHGAEVHQQFRYTIPHAYVSANRDSETQTRSFGFRATRRYGHFAARGIFRLR